MIKQLFNSKKGEGIVNIIIIVGILFLILLGGLGLAFGGMTLDWVFDEAIPELTTIGMVGESNVSAATSMALTPVNNVVQSFTWMSGVVYVLALLGLVGLSIGFRITGNKWLMAFFVACMLLLVISSIFISNIYEDFYDDTGEVAMRLHEYAILSFFILYAPMIICVIGFVCGIIMFTGGSEEERYE